MLRLQAVQQTCTYILVLPLTNGKFHYKCSQSHAQVIVSILWVYVKGSEGVVGQLQSKHTTALHLLNVRENSQQQYVERKTSLYASFTSDTMYSLHLPQFKLAYAAREKIMKNRRAVEQSACV